MTETPAWLLLAGVLFLLLLFVGTFAAIIIYLGKGQSEDQAEQERAERPQPPVAAAKTVEPAPVLEAPAHPGEVMRVIRDEQTGQVLVQVDGQRYAHIREIADAQIGRRVLWAIADLVRFTGGMATNPQAIRSVEAKSPPASQTPRPSPPAAPPLQQAAREEPRAPTIQSPVSSPPPRTPTPQAQPTRDQYSLVDFFRKGFERAAPAEPLPSPTLFIDEIEEVLQARIRSLAQPLQQEVHVLTGDDGALCIEVGYDTYASPDEVPDLQIRQLIKDAVAEWEKR